jgi:hypothetical protein
VTIARRHEMRLVEGSTVVVHCSECGRHEWAITVLEGSQRLHCPECGQPTVVEFSLGDDDRFRMNVR